MSKKIEKQNLKYSSRKEQIQSKSMKSQPNIKRLTPYSDVASPKIIKNMVPDNENNFSFYNIYPCYNYEEIYPTQLDIGLSNMPLKNGAVS